MLELNIYGLRKITFAFQSKRDEIFQSTTITKNSFTTARNVAIQPINVYCVRRQNILVQIFRLPPEYELVDSEREVQQH